MRLRRTVILICILGVLGLGVGTARPRAARADTQTDIIIGVVGFAAWVGMILLATKLIYGAQPASTSLEDPLRTYEEADDEVRFVTHCRQEGGNVTVACW
jgi:hypothetical protein